ncbi:MAG: hypothetical protein R3F11_03950 [Verrucomicrobiales bacterium]
MADLSPTSSAGRNSSVALRHNSGPWSGSAASHSPAGSRQRNRADHHGEQRADGQGRGGRSARIFQRRSPM